MSKNRRAVPTKCVLFDMDGTLCNTWLDLARAVQAAMIDHSFPPPTDEDVLRFVGNGSFKLIELALPPDKKEYITECERYFQDYYRAHLTIHTAPYAGITETLSELKKRGISLGVVSNKSIGPLTEIVSAFFPMTFGAVFGGSPERPLKPAPDMLLAAAEALGAAKDEVIYVGDSDVDVAAARNAGFKGVFCSWGFQPREKLTAAGAENIIDSPPELINYID